MSNTASRRDFLKSVGLATSALGLGPAAPAQEKSQTQKGASSSGTRLEEHPFELMICDYVKFKLSRVDTRGKVIWEHRPEGKVWDFVLTDDDKIIYPIITDKQEVRCIDFQKNRIWSWPYAMELTFRWLRSRFEANWLAWFQSRRLDGLPSLRSGRF
jgi:hypothetical protein